MAFKRQIMFAVDQGLWIWVLFQSKRTVWSFIHLINLCAAHTQNYYIRRDWQVAQVFLKWRVSYSFSREEATAIKTLKIQFKQMFPIFFPSLLWLFKQHNSGFVSAIWSTVNSSWPVDAMPTTASKWITLCWRIMDIDSSGILFTIFCKNRCMY